MSAPSQSSSRLFTDKAVFSISHLKRPWYLFPFFFHIISPPIFICFRAPKESSLRSEKESRPGFRLSRHAHLRRDRHAVASNVHHRWRHHRHPPTHRSLSTLFWFKSCSNIFICFVFYSPFDFFVDALFFAPLALSCSTGLQWYASLYISGNLGFGVSSVGSAGSGLGSVRKAHTEYFYGAVFLFIFFIYPFMPGIFWSSTPGGGGGLVGPARYYFFAAKCPIFSPSPFSSVPRHSPRFPSNVEFTGGMLHLTCMTPTSRETLSLI